jgi:DNA-directed RNA polymerase specialized sigma24 family protein
VIAGPAEWGWPGERRARTETVAVVDDDPDILSYASAILEHAGFRVVADDGTAGVGARLGKVLECRSLGGVTERETAEALGVSARTVKRDWVKARVLLRSLLED